MEAQVRKSRMLHRIGRILLPSLCACSAAIAHAQGNVSTLPATAKGSVEFSYIGFYQPSNPPWFSTLQSACAANAAYLSGLRDMWAGAYCSETHVEPDNIRGYWIASIVFPNWPNVSVNWVTEAVYTRGICPSGYNNGTFTWDETTSPRSMVFICSRSSYSCPANSTGTQNNPTTCTCNAGYAPDPTRTSCVPSNLIITLSGGSEVEPSKGSDKNPLPFIATVIDQNTGQPTTNQVQVHISLKVDPTSGGHDHGDNTRPRGGIAGVQTCTSDAECWSNPTSNGAVVFNFNPPEASGTHTITATCDGCSNTATKSVDVKVDGLSPIPVSPFYALNEANGDVIGARAGWHIDNHNLTHEAALKLVRIAVKYRFDPKFMVIVNTSTNQKDFPPVLHINDASLPWGGVYDICARPGACPDLGTVAWQEPHAEHRRGTVVDIRANGGDGSIPISDKAKFARLLINSGVPYLQESRGTSNEHFHLRLLGNRE